MRTIASSNQKGGCGKTLTLVSSASELAKRRKRALIIDGDPHGAASFHLRHSIRNSGKPTLYDILTGKAFPIDCIQQTEFSGLSIITSDERLSELEDAQGLVRNVLDMADQLAHAFDYIFLDTPPASSRYRDALMMMVDDVLIPIFAEPDSIQGLGRQLKEWKRWSDAREEWTGREINLLGVIVTNYNERYATHRNTLPDIKEVLEDKEIPLLAVVPASGSASNAPESGIPVPWQGKLKSTRIYKAFQSLALGIEKGAGRTSIKKPIVNSIDDDITEAIEI